MLYFRYFVAGIWKYYCHIWHQRPGICLLAKFDVKIKILKFGTKNAWFEYFWTGNWKLFRHIWNQDPRIFLIAGILQNYCHIWNQQLQICLIAKFCKETKMTTFGIKNAIFGYFSPRMPYLGIFGQEFKKNYCQIWNQHPQICLFAKFQ